MQRCRDGGLAGLQYRLCQLLDEQRHAVSARDDRIDRCERQTVAVKARDHRLDPGAGEPVEGQASDVRVGSQGGLLVRPAGQKHQDACIGNPIQALLDHLERGRVDPMGVFEDHQHRLSCSQPEQLLDQGSERARSPRLGCQMELAVARARRRDRSGGDQRRGLDVIRSAEQRLQLVNPASSESSGGHTRGMGQLLDHRPKGTFKVVG